MNLVNIRQGIGFLLSITKPLPKSYYAALYVINKSMSTDCIIKLFAFVVQYDTYERTI